MKPNSCSISPIRAAALLAMVLPSSLQAATVLNDTFSDNERATQSLTGSAEWAFAPNGANANTALNASTGALVYTPTVQAAQYSTAYFTVSGLPVSLAVGETITLSYDFSLSNVVNVVSGLQIGLYNSNGTRYAAGFSGAAQPFSNNAITGATTGYFIRANPGDNTGIFELREESAGPGAAFVSNSIALGTPGVSSFSLAANTTYSGSLSITSNGVTTSVSSSINGVTITATDTSTLKTSFDTVSFFTSSAAVPVAGSFTIDNVNVSVIPEPSSTLLGGLGALALLRRRRD